MSTAYSEHYARFHAETPEHDTHLRHLFARWLESHLPANRQAAILDVGCGRGYAVSWLRAKGYSNVEGIDPDAGQVAYGQARAWPVRQIQDPGDFLRQSPARYDLVLLMDVLEHVPVPKQIDFLQSISACLRPEGRLICTVPNASSVIGSHWRFIDYTHTSAFTTSGLQFALESASLVVESIDGVEFFPRPRYLFWLPTRRAVQWWLLQLVRLYWRLTYLAELGIKQGGRIPLSLNLLAVARRVE